MLRSLSFPLRFLPLCSVFLLAGADEGCVIHVTAEDEDEECIDLAEYCPALICEVYATDKDGCQICECAVGEGEGEGEGECSSDADCGPGLICELFESCTFEDKPNSGEQPSPAPPDEGDRPSECEVIGFCTDPNLFGCANVLCEEGFVCVEDAAGNPMCIADDGLCFFDGDCNADERCNLDSCTGACDAPDGAKCLVACQGFCEPVQSQVCFDDAECPEGFFCDLSGTDPSTGGGDVDCRPDDNGGCSGVPIAPPPGVCREEVIACPAVFVICEDGSEPVDLDGDGCPLECADDKCAALCDPGAECVVFDDGTIGCVPVSTAECTSDEQCADGATCNAGDVCLQNPNCEPGGTCTDECWGFCVSPEPTSCLEDAECADGERCELKESCDVCPDGSENCLVPCFLTGVCVPADAPTP
jgi:hypothetical protein